MDDMGGTTWMSPNYNKDINITKNKEDSARAQPPASPSVPPFFKDKKRKQTSASPPRQKEKHPPNSVSLELTNEERLKLRNILGSELEKYEEKQNLSLS